ncbi:MAG: ATP-binding protein [Atopobiaceae bacterium]|nr:ATP-binding protein [Atopobiaceae bacterium]
MRCKTKEMFDVVGGIGMCNVEPTVLVIHGDSGCGKTRLASEIMRFADAQCGWDTHVGLEGFGSAEVLVLDDEPLSCVSDLAQLLDAGAINGRIVNRFVEPSVTLPKLVIITTQCDLDDTDFTEAMSRLSRLCHCLSVELKGLVVD